MVRLRWIGYDDFHAQPTSSCSARDKQCSTKKLLADHTTSSLPSPRANASRADKMCQFSLPAESLIASYSSFREIDDREDTEFSSCSPPKLLYKMQYASALVLGFINAFSLAIPSSNSNLIAALRQKDEVTNIMQ